MPKLNMWQRLGLVVTALWIAVTGVYWIHRIVECHRTAATWDCDFIASNAARTDQWFWAIPTALGFWHIGLIGNALFATLVFPALSWAAALTITYATRWILAGRN